MYLIVYLSDYSGDVQSLSSDINDISKTAKKNNPMHAISGVLFYQNGRFMQVIEGPEPALRTLMRKIEADKRHANIVILFDENIHSRGFDEWNMDTFDLDEDKTLDTPEMKRIMAALKRTVIPRADNLVELYETFLQDKVFK